MIISVDIIVNNIHILVGRVLVSRTDNVGSTVSLLSKVSNWTLN